MGKMSIKRIICFLICSLFPILLIGQVIKSEKAYLKIKTDPVVLKSENLKNSPKIEIIDRLSVGHQNM